AGLLQLLTSHTTDTLLIDFSVKSFSIVVQRDKQVIFQQNYQYDDNEEFTYYLLLTINHLNIDTKNIQVKLSGIIHEGDEKWKSVSQYFNQVSFLAVASRLDVSILDDMPVHYYT